ncbi:methylthioribose kinase [Fictibacillus aquaticus]|uniref:Methylthioribose kinase n=1 Tax=Fictibacillus aquaticus TaxID=2021314 RepID=A0A235FCA4_9BACL|nr:methylthioribose kinase [Fictibacillus aquaticus]OYD58968.1 methylthioribose kinase [Fictibacillus aquaticus]
MIQKFIELGEGYSDLYELIELGRANKHRISSLLCLHTKKGDNEFASVIITLQPAAEGKFLPLYICREGIPAHSKRYQLFMDFAEEAGIKPIVFDVKNSEEFADKEIYFHYLTGILRLNYLLPPLQ